jgi:hypothetical protein
VCPLFNESKTGTSVQSNWAGCDDKVNCRQVVQGPNPNSFQSHLRIVNDNGYIKVCQCPINQLAQCDSACGPAFNPATQAFYKNIYNANGCKNQDCIYKIVADIWNVRGVTRAQDTHTYTPMTHVDLMYMPPTGLLG